MNNIYKLLIIGFIMSIFHNAQAYRWIMNNFTDKILLVQIELLHSKNPYFVLVKPKQSADFDWSPGNVMAGFCLGKIKYIVLDPKDYLLKQQGIISRLTMEVRDNQKLLEWLNHYSTMEKAKTIGLKQPYTRKVGDLRFMKDENYNKMVEHAKQLTGTKGGAKIVQFFADMVAQSKCRSRDISIVQDDKGDIGFYTLAN